MTWHGPGEKHFVCVCVCLCVCASLLRCECVFSRKRGHVFVCVRMCVCLCKIVLSQALTCYHLCVSNTN